MVTRFRLSNLNWLQDLDLSNLVWYPTITSFWKKKFILKQKTVICLISCLNTFWKIISIMIEKKFEYSFEIHPGLFLWNVNKTWKLIKCSVLIHLMGTQYLEICKYKIILSQFSQVSSTTCYLCKLVLRNFCTISETELPSSAPIQLSWVEIALISQLNWTHPQPMILVFKLSSPNWLSKPAVNE